MTATPGLLVIVSVLLSTAGTLLGLYLSARWKRKERAEEIEDAAQEKLSALGQKLIDRYDASAAALALQLAECRTRQAELYNHNLTLLGDKATLARENRSLEEDLTEVRRELSDAGARYVHLVSALDEAGLMLSPRGRVVKKEGTGERQIGGG